MMADAVGAEATYRRASAELERADAEGDGMRRRQAAEKAWLAVVEATDGFLKSRGRKVPEDETAHSERRAELLSLGEREMVRSHSYFAATLHGDCFYFDRCPPEAVLRDIFREVEEYVLTARRKP